MVLVTGGFDPIHSGHIEYFNAAKQLGDYLVVGLNSDDWLKRKKGRSFMNWQERKSIISNLKMVDEIIAFDDSDNSASDAIRKVLSRTDETIIFANGGDRSKGNIPEENIERVEFYYGVGGDDKKNSSSWILEEWKAPKTIRPWGYYRVLYELPNCKVKELVVEPGASLSMQRHANRYEVWFVSEGIATINWANSNKTELFKHETQLILEKQWHQLSNNTDSVLKIVEIQYGNRCEEEDIERKDAALEKRLEELRKSDPFIYK